MIVNSTYRQGTDRDGKPSDIQDAYFDNLPNVGVADCHSGFNNTFNSGGVVRDILLEKMNVSGDGASLEERINCANNTIDHFQKDERFKFRAGAVFALAQIGDKPVQIIQGGDSIVVWRLKLGEIGFTKNQYENYDIQAVANFARLMKKYNENEQKVWPEHREFLANIRERFANRKYPVLNGDPRIKDCWFTIKIPKKSLDSMLFFTDGLIAGLPGYKNTETLMKEIFGRSKEQGLDGLINWVRNIQKKTLRHSHCRQPEISIVSVTF